MSQEISVKLPGPLVWEIWKRAETEGISPGEVIKQAFTKPVVKTPTATEATRARIVELVRAGVDDGAIAVELDRTRGYVADVRRKAGLKANPRMSRYDVARVLEAT
ncbi:hypothetical protein [Leucobacter aridicollis]|uniref:hypothetical protein n=1 Tax=Leucobacter aridicollis TaxID=283878 RepID=UPI002169D691|nr:hypothetical protein [Leucobacter aridicollis]MCS3426709.1 hypothetical protein [Leucobacter aridicollis]